MKNYSLIKKVISYVFIFYGTLNLVNSQNLPKPQNFSNFYGICWRGSPHENLSFARQMHYDYVFYQHGMEYDSLSNGLYFYLETPESYTYIRRIYLNKKYTEEQKKYFESITARKSGIKDFPSDIATGWNRLVNCVMQNRLCLIS